MDFADSTVMLFEQKSWRKSDGEMEEMKKAFEEAKKMKKTMRGVGTASQMLSLAVLHV